MPNGYSMIKMNIMNIGLGITRGTDSQKLASPVKQNVGTVTSHIYIYNIVRAMLHQITTTSNSVNPHAVFHAKTSG